MATLREALKDWTDTDWAMHKIAICLGLMPEGTFPKHVFWSNNAVGNMLHDFLMQMISSGILEQREGPTDTQFRWNLAFKGS